MTRCRKSSSSIITDIYYNSFVEYIANMFIKTNVECLWIFCIKSEIKKKYREILGVMGTLIF